MAQKKFTSINNNELTYVMKTNKRGVTKRHEIFFYSCVRRYYNILDRRTRETETKRMWIVIGDGHKRYRKFETQADAIRYFRKLKKFARMRVQSVNSKEFIKMTSTFMLMEHQGVNIVEPPEVEEEVELNTVINESQNFEDQYSQYEDVSEEESEQLQAVDHEEIDKVLAEQDGDSFIGSTEEIEQINQAEVQTVIEEDEDDEEDRDITYVKTQEIPIIYEESTKTIEPQVQSLPSQVVQPQEQTTTLIVEKRMYNKGNPCLFDKYEDRNGFIVFYDVLKFIIVFAMIFFAISSIWYYAKWSENALANIGINFDDYKQDAAPQDWSKIYNFIHTDEYLAASKLGITQWVGIAVSPEMLLVLVIMSGVGVFFSVLALATKRGTVWSFFTLIVTFALLIVVVTLFVTIYNQVGTVVKIFKDIRFKPLATVDEVLKSIQKILEKITGKIVQIPPTGN